MTRSKILATALVAILSSGTLATQSYAASKSYCRAYAEDVADHRTGAQQVVGAVGGRRGKQPPWRRHWRKTRRAPGIIAGGVTGGVLGGAHASKKWEKVYWRAYRECRSW
jgi:hypothetical protein